MDFIAMILMVVGPLAFAAGIAAFIYKNRVQFNREVDAVKK
jgi:hypothetical protein